jgi:hypothetical protein
VDATFNLSLKPGSELMHTIRLSNTLGPLLSSMGLNEDLFVDVPLS